MTAPHLPPFPLPHPITRAQHDAEVSRLLGYLATALEEPADGGVRKKIVRIERRA